MELLTGLQPHSPQKHQLQTLKMSTWTRTLHHPRRILLYNNDLSGNLRPKIMFMLLSKQGCLHKPLYLSAFTIMSEKRDQSQRNHECMSALLSREYELINMNPILQYCSSNRNLSNPIFEGIYLCCSHYNQTKDTFFGVWGGKVPLSETAK